MITPAQIREARGPLTQSQAAEVLQVSQRQWRNYETGKTPMKDRDFDYFKNALTKETISAILESQ